jgi:hypothetical protein
VAVPRFAVYVCAELLSKAPELEHPLTLRARMVTARMSINFIAVDLLQNRKGRPPFVARWSSLEE